MKIFLIASLVLLPLALAHPHHGYYHDHHNHDDDHDHPVNHDPHPNHPAYKFIFDKGLVISESINIKKIDVENKGATLVFTVVHEDSDPDDVMEIARGDAKWEDLQFVVEGLDYHDDDHEDYWECDDSSMKNLIKACHGHIHLRGIHDDEKDEAAGANDALNAEAPRRIKVFYNHDHMVSLHKLKTVVELKIEKINRTTLVVQTLQDPPTNAKIVVKSPTKIVNESFTIVAVKPAPQMCIVHSDIASLVKFCSGDILFRKLTPAELGHIMFI